MPKFLFILLLLSYSSRTFAEFSEDYYRGVIFPVSDEPNGSHAATPYGNTSLKPLNRHTLFVTHAQNNFIKDESCTTQTNRVIDAFKKKHHPIIYILQVNQNLPGESYVRDARPTMVLYHEAGDHRVECDSPEITVLGGLADWCQQRTVDSAIYQHFLHQKEPFTVNLPMEAIFVGSPSVLERDKRTGENKLKTMSLSAFRADLDSRGEISELKGLFVGEEKTTPYERFLRVIYSSDPEIRLAYEKRSLGDYIAERGLKLEDFPADPTPIGYPRKNRRVEFYLDNRFLFTEGEGNEIVKLKFWSKAEDFCQKVVSELVDLPEEAVWDYITLPEKRKDSPITDNPSFTVEPPTAKPPSE